MPKSTPTRQREPPTADTHDDRWVDEVTDQVQALLSEHGLELELVAFYDPLTEVLHATGYDGAPARYFANLPAPSDSAGPAPTAPPPGTVLPRTGQLPPALGPRSRGNLTTATGSLESQIDSRL